MSGSSNFEAALKLNDNESDTASRNIEFDGKDMTPVTSDDSWEPIGNLNCLWYKFL
jgi:hypothetical protein